MSTHDYLRFFGNYLACLAMQPFFWLSLAFVAMAIWQECKR